MHQQHCVPAPDRMLKCQRFLIGSEQAFHRAPQARFPLLRRCSNLVAVDQLDGSLLDPGAEQGRLRCLGLGQRVVDGDDLAVVNVGIVQVYVVSSGRQVGRLV